MKKSKTTMRHEYLINKKHEEQIYKTLYSEFHTRFGSLSAQSLLLKAREDFPLNHALKTTDGTVITYKKLFEKASAIALHMQSQGISSSSHVLLFVENSIEFYLLYWATLLCDAVVIPVNTFLHANELAYIIQDSTPALIVVSERLESILQEAFSLIVLPEKPPLVCLDHVLCNKSLPAQNTPMPSHKNEDDTAVILYTSGTTGKPKGVVLSSKNIVSNSMQAAARFRLLSHEQETFFAILPLFHAFAQNTCLWLPAMTGSCVIVISKIERSAILEGLKLKPTIFLGTPALYGLLCLMKTADLSSIKLFISGADALPDKYRSAFSLLYGRKILSGYGLTEASPVVAINYLNEDRPTNNVGRPVIGIEVEIRNEDGSVLKNNQIGVLWIKGPNIMKGYYKAEESTEEIIQKGWLCTGDLASLNEHNEISIHGRNKDLIIHKGFNIYPQEVENVLLKSSLVMKAAVVGRFDEASGQIPVAYVALKASKKNVEHDLKQLCASHLAAYKIPRIFIFKEDLPLSPTGKIDKKQLQMKT